MKYSALSLSHIASVLLFLIMFLPKNVYSEDIVGNLSGEITVGSGSTTFSLPISAPDGIHGLNPEISVHYNQNSGSGTLGIGFSLAAGSYISRCTPSKIKDGFIAGIELNDNARFCHDGKRLKATSDREYRKYINNNSKYISIGGTADTPEYWQEYTPEGYTIKYERVGIQQEKYTNWMITKVTDHFGNAMNYSYTDETIPLLSKINYSGYSIRFVYESREQAVGQYRSGHYHELLHRLEKIQIEKSTVSLYEYRFAYESIPTVVASERLISISRCYGNNGSDGCIKPLQFGYMEQPDASQPLDHPDDRTLVIPRSFYAESQEFGNLSVYQRPNYTTANLNNDGYADFCYYHVSLGVVCALSASDGSGNYAEPTNWTEDLGFDAVEEDFAYYNNLLMRDINADGKDDLCIADEKGIQCAINQGNDFGDLSYWNTVLSSESKPTFTSLNDDPLPEVCGLTDGQVYKCFSSNGASFQNSLLSISDVDSSFERTWEQQSQRSVEESLDMSAPQWIDIDADLDQDLCWLSARIGALKCAFSSRSTASGDIVFSNPSTLIELDYEGLESDTLPEVDSSAAVNDGYYYFDFAHLKVAVDDLKVKARDFVLALRFVDLNSDALPDICYESEKRMVCRINTGVGFLEETSWLNLQPVFDLGDTYRTALATLNLRDINYDSLPDFCIIYNNLERCAYNQLNGFGDLFNRQAIAADINQDTTNQQVYDNFVRRWFGEKTRYIFGAVSFGYGNIVSVGDLNNDGFSEFCYRSVHGIICSSNDTHGPYALLTRVTDSFGQITDIEYDNLIGGNLYEPALSIPSGFYENPSNTYVVKSITSDSGAVQGGSALRNVKSFKYGGYLVNPSTGVAGFSRMTTKQDVLGTKTISELFLERDLAGRERIIDHYIDNVKVKHKENHFSIANAGDGTRRVRLEKVLETQYNLDGSLVSSITSTYSDFDAYGMPETSTVTKEMADSEYLSTTTQTEYLHDTALWLIARPDYQSVTHTSAESTVSREVDYIYQNGVLNREVIQPNSTKALTIEYGYDNYGNTTEVKSTGSGETRRITKTFDSLGRVTSASNELGQTESFSYHEKCGGTETYTDIANKTLTTYYDLACRKIRQEAHDSNATDWTYAWASAADLAANTQPSNFPYLYRNPILYKVTETNAVGTWSTSYFDAQGREVKTESVGFSPGQVQRQVLSNTLYDRFGRKTATTLPYYKIDGSLTTPSWMRVVYDRASRIKTEHKTGADGQPHTVAYAYSGNAVTMSYSDYRKTTVEGVHQKPTSITENDLVVSYTYDAIGNLLTTKQNGVTDRIEYDDRGFKKQHNNPDTGLWKYEYNAFGELVEQIDANYATTTFQYDKLGRQKVRISPEGQTTWTYHASGNGIGQLYKEVSPSATREWIYNASGSVSQQVLLVDNERFVTQYDYDNFSRLRKTTQPNGVDIHTEYDNLGLVNNIQVPADQFEDLDFSLLKEEYDAVALHIISLESDIAVLQQRIDHHLTRSMYYQRQATRYARLYDAVTGNEDLQALIASAEAHENAAAQYRQAANDLAGQAANLRNIYGDREFTYKETQNGTYKFVAEWCAKKKKVLGGLLGRRCREKRTEFVELQVGNINPQSGSNNAVYFFKEEDVEVCTIKNRGRGGFGGKQTCDIVRRGAPSCKALPPSRANTNRRSCTAIKPHESYSAAAASFRQLAELEASAASASRDKVALEDAVQVLMPIEVVNEVLVPIAGDIAIFIPAQVTRIQNQLQTVTYAQAQDFYLERESHYEALAQQELNKRQLLTDDIANLWADMDDMVAAERSFYDSLENAGIAVGEDQTVGQVIDDAYEQQQSYVGKLASVWLATMRTAQGQLQSELFGNGLYTKREFNPHTGLLKTIETGAYSDPNPLRKIEYAYNNRGSVINKIDGTTNKMQTSESYEYDRQGRLTAWDFSQTVVENFSLSDRNINRTYDYDPSGNMTFKTGAGTMRYDSPGNRLTSRNQGGTTYSYSYDSNGNMVSGDGRNYEWTSFNKASRITRGSTAVLFDYDAAQKRVKKTAANETTYYVNPSYERVVRNENGSDVTIHRHHIWNGDDVVATFEKRDQADASMLEGKDQVAYYHRDMLGSGELVTGSDMEVVARRFYSPFGERIGDILKAQNVQALNVQQSASIGDTVDYIQLLTENIERHQSISILSEYQAGVSGFSGHLRGFTSHEHIEEIGLVNMNARLYDPVIARFVSADSVIPDPVTPMAYNRYAYVKNNPMLYRDPSGNYWVVAAFAFFVGAHLTDNEALQVISSVVLAATLSTWTFGDPTGYTWQTAAAAAGTSSFTVTYLKTGDLSASFEAASWSALSAGVSHRIGTLAGQDKFKLGDWYNKAAAHGLTQGVIAELRGGEFASGFVSGLISSASGEALNRLGLGNPNTTSEIAASVALVAAFGYASAKAVGGNGVTGALAAASVHLYNELSHGQRGQGFRGRSPSAPKATREQNLKSLSGVNKISGVLADASVAATLVCPKCIVVTGPVAGIATGVELMTDAASLDYESVLKTSTEEIVGGAVDYSLKKAPLIRLAPESVRTQIKAGPETIYNIIDNGLELSE